MKKILIFMLLLIPNLCYAKDIIITIPDDIYERVVESFQGDVADSLLQEIRTKLIEHETFIASVQAANQRKDELTNLNIGEIKDPKKYIEDSTKPVDNVNWEDIEVIK